MTKKIIPKLPTFRASLLSIFLLLLTTCGGYDPEGTSGTGNIAFTIDWQGAPTQSPPFKKGGEGGFERTAPLDCTAAGVSTVTATVYSSTGSSLATGGPWNCSDHSGYIYRVPAGLNRKLTVQGKDSSGNILYSGEQTGIIVVDGYTSSTVTVTVTPTGTAPSAPTGVSATAGNGQVTISWTAVTGATSYNIYWSAISGVTKTNGTKLTGATSPYTHTGRTNGTTYYYVVTAVNSYGESSESSQVSATPTATIVADTTAPSSPSVSINGGAASTTSSSVTLTLSAADNVGVTGYYVSESPITPSLTATGWVTVSAAANYSGTLSSNLSSSSGTKTVYVWFRDAAGNISSSANSSISLTASGDTTAPSSPSVSIDSGAASTSSTSVTLTLSTTDNVGVTGYCVKESSTTPSSNDTCWTSVTSTTSYSGSVSFTLSSGDGTKTVYVWFKDAAGNVSASASDSITLGSAPSAPTGVSASAGNGQATISWSSVSGATSYNIYWSTSSGVTKTTGTQIPNTTSPYTHTGLTNGTTYYYVVTAVNSYGESSESSQVSAIPAILTYANCIGWKNAGYSTDGNYTIDIDGSGSKPSFTVYCKDMATSSPKEYLTLSVTGGTNNYTYYTAYTGSTYTCNFTKVHFADVSTLKIDISHQNQDSHAFATCVGTGNSTYWYSQYGIAGDCYATGSNNGRMNIDLTGTAFKVSSSVSWVSDGWIPGDNKITSNTNNIILNAQGGGYCGGLIPKVSGNTALYFDFQ